jgi:hypothetical protein
MRPRLRAIVAVILLAAPASVLAQTAPPAILPCAIPADDSWTPQEKTAWARICGDQVADFTIEPGYGGTIDPQTGKLPENQTLSARFIATILTDDKYRGGLKRHGVRVAAAQFTDKIDVQNIQLATELWFDQCVFAVDVDMSWLQSSQPVGFSRSKSAAALNFYAVQIASDVHIIDSTIASVNLAGAHIGRTLDLGQNSHITGEVDMHGIDVGVDLMMKNGVYSNVNLLGAHVGHTLSMTKSTIVGELGMVNLQVGTDLLMDNAVFQGEVNLLYSQIGGELDWRGASFADDVDLTRAHLGGAFRLGSQAQHDFATWSPQKTFTARYAKFAVIPRLSDAWPYNLDIVELTYEGIEDTSDDFHPWFERQDYSRQPYEQLASVLQAEGEIEKATEVRFAERDRDRSEQSGWIYGWLTLLWAVIGYGYYPYYSLYWVGGFVLLGMAVLWVTGEGRRNHMPYGFSYSFDLLLPIIQLRPEHYAIDLNGWARYYFYIHKIAGWALATFLLAGLSGLTK